MAISYPLTLPTATGISGITIRAISKTALSKSPYTSRQQVYRYSGAMWEAEVRLPPMKRDAAEQWITFFLKLDGHYGTFLMGDPDATTRGTVNSMTVSGQAGSRTASVTLASGKTFKAGDYFQLGSGSSARLHKALTDVTGTGAGVDMEIWPMLRTTYVSSSAEYANPVGNWRLASNSSEWTTDEVSKYGLSFSCLEAL